MNSKVKGAIAGLGLTKQGKIYGKTSRDFAVEAIKLALDDAGLKKTDLDGIMISQGMASRMGAPGVCGLDIQDALGLTDLNLLSIVDAYGSTLGQTVQYAAGAISGGLAEVIAIVYSDAPLVGGASAGASFSMTGVASGIAGLSTAAGILGAPTMYAMAATEHMTKFGTTSQQLGAIALSGRKWAMMNPHAVVRKPMTMEDHQASRYVAEPLHLLDCCMVNNGGGAIIMTSPERARDLKQPPVYVIGWGQGHPGMSRSDKLLVTGAVDSGKRAMQMAGITTKDVNVCEIYDCFTITTLVTLEDYGFCKKGEGGAFVADGKLAPGGSLPTNTGGGQLSGYYMMGMTPLTEAVIQARGQGGERQVPKHDIVLVSGNGGLLDYHSTLVLTKHA